MASIQKSVDVDVPVRTAYNQWTQFEKFPSFMKGIESVQQLDSWRLRWRAKIGGQAVEWTAEIVEQVPDQRIAWRTLAGPDNNGVISFTTLGPGRTRVSLRMEYEPEGLSQVAGDAFGVVSHRVSAALEAFKQFIESVGRETGAWRGAIPSTSTLSSGRSGPPPSPFV